MTVENKIQPFGVVPLTTELLTVLGRKCPSGRFASLLSSVSLWPRNPLEPAGFVVTLWLAPIREVPNVDR